MANVSQIIIPFHQYCLQKMSNFYEESTNFTSNPLNPQNNLLKQKLIEQPAPHFEEDNSKTITFHKLSANIEDVTVKLSKLPKKIKPPLQNQNQKYADSQINPKKQIQFFVIDQDITTKTRRNKPDKKNINLIQGVQQETIFSIQHQAKKENNKVHCDAQKIKLPEPCPKVQSILSGPKLRQKYGHLLPKCHQKTISFEQQHLLRILSIMDETIQFSTKNRSLKFMFFEELRKLIRDSLRIFIEMKHLQQLLYLDQNLYETKWEWSYEKKGYDVMIVQPKIHSKDERKIKVRQTIIDFLNEKHRQFLILKGISLSLFDDQWHQEFETAKYQIPRKPMAPHPETKQAQLRCFDDGKIGDIKNSKLKSLIQTKKIQTDVQSFKSKSVMDMIFSGSNSKSIKSQILTAVKQREISLKAAHVQEQQRVQRQKTMVDPQILKQISQSILLIYMSKSVTNLFKVKLIELVKQRTNNKFGNFVTERHIQHLIELKDIGYLKEVIPSPNKPIIVQINKTKAKDILNYTQSLKETIKQEENKSKDLNGLKNMVITI